MLIYSHLACADRSNDAFTLQQIQIFEQIVAAIDDKNIIAHLANSGGVCYYPSSYFQMVRPGLLAYGYYPEKKCDIDVEPCFSLKSIISYCKIVEAGQGISYGHSYITKDRTKIVTIPIGYGDGYPRILSNKGFVLIRGNKNPIVGTICMDQLMVALQTDEALVGEAVTLIGKQGKEEISIEEIAKKCLTIPYDILCRFSKRVSKIYLTSSSF